MQNKLAMHAGSKAIFLFFTSKNHANHKNGLASQLMPDFPPNTANGPAMSVSIPVLQCSSVQKTIVNSEQTKSNIEMISVANLNPDIDSMCISSSSEKGMVAVKEYYY